MQFSELFGDLSTLDEKLRTTKRPVLQKSPKLAKARFKRDFGVVHNVAVHQRLQIGNYTFAGMLTRIIAVETTAGRLTYDDIIKAAKSFEDTTPAKQSSNVGNGCTDACIVEQLEKLGLEGDLFLKDRCFNVSDRSGKKVCLWCKRKCKCVVSSKTQKPRVTKEPAETSFLDLCNEGLKDWDEVTISCPHLPSYDAKDIGKRPWAKRPFLQRCPNLSSDNAKDCGEHPRVEKHLPQSCPNLSSNDAEDCGKRPRVESDSRVVHNVAVHQTLQIGNYTFAGMLTWIIAVETTAGRLTTEDIIKAAKSFEDTSPAKQSSNVGNGCTEACIVEQLEKKVMEKLGLEGDLRRTAASLSLTGAAEKFV